MGTKTVTNYTYYEPSGLVATVTGPQPGTVGQPAIVLVAYTYDALGNVTSIKTPGPNSTPAATTASAGFSTYVTTTLNYTADAAYTTTDGTNYPARSAVPDATGEPLAVTDPLGHTTHFRYQETVPYEPVSGTPINRGHATSVTDAGNSTTAGAPGDETQTAYNIDDRPLSTLYPKTGQSGSGRGSTVSQYLYDESGDTGGYEQYGPLQNVQTFDESNATSAFRRSTTPTGRRARPWASPGPPSRRPTSTTPSTGCPRSRTAAATPPATSTMPPATCTRPPTPCPGPPPRPSPPGLRTR